MNKTLIISYDEYYIYVESGKTGEKVKILIEDAIDSNLAELIKLLEKCR